jgi:exosortase/archaeosortase
MMTKLQTLPEPTILRGTEQIVLAKPTTLTIPYQEYPQQSSSNQHNEVSRTEIVLACFAVTALSLIAGSVGLLGVCGCAF